MVCPFCHHKKTITTNSRPRAKESSTWRRRHCSSCKTTFTTEERPALDSNTLVSSQAGSTPFSIGRLTLSIAQSFLGANADEEAAYELARTVEQRLLSHKQALSSDSIKDEVYRVLDSYNQAAALIYKAQHNI